LSAAERLFEDRGYDHVTVAEIADAANISVKTLFTYFRSKEDLAFGDENWLRDALLAAMARRPSGTTAADAVADELVTLLRTRGSDIESFHRSVGDSLALQGRLRQMWESYEDAFTVAVAAERGEPAPSPAARLTACILVAIARSITSPELREQVRACETAQAREQVAVGWVREAQSLVRISLLSERAVVPARRTCHARPPVGHPGLPRQLTAGRQRDAPICQHPAEQVGAVGDDAVGA
jgi:AcrR family transcriptional regulator